jgi:hypothetical protein
MANSVQVTGGPEMEKALKQLDVLARGPARTKALRAGANVVKRDVKRRAKKSSSTKRTGKNRPPPGQLAKNIVVRMRKYQNDQIGVAVVTADYGTGGAPHAHLWEFGHKVTPPPTQDGKISKVQGKAGLANAWDSTRTKRNAAIAAALRKEIARLTGA